MNFNWLRGERLLIGWMVVSLAANIVRAQDSERPAPNTREQRIDLVILLDAPGVSGLSGETYVQKVKAIVAEQTDLNFDFITIERKSPAEFDILKRFIADPESFVEGAEFKPIIEPADGNSWLVSLDQRNLQFVALELDFRTANGGNARARILPSSETQPTGVEEAQLVAIPDAVGEYRLTLPDAWQPREYQVIYKQGDEEKPQERRAWPEARFKYVLKIGGFRGGAQGQKRLFDLLADPKQANPLVFLGTTRPALFANLHVDEANRGAMSSWREDVFTIRMPPLASTEAPTSRAWICFPLTNERLAELTRKLRSRELVGGWEPGELLAAIKGELELGAGDRFTASTAARDVLTALQPGGVETWYELPPVLSPDGKAMFLERSFKAERIAEWQQQLQNASGCRALVVYEGLDRGRPVARLVDVGGRKILWEEQGLEHWITGIQKLNERTANE